MSENILNQSLITDALKTSFIGKNLLYYPTVTSTMDIARREASRKAPEGTAILADEQTTGRGRLKRQWLTPAGNIALSIILYPPKPYLPQLIMLSSLAVLDSIEKTTGLKCRLKWPNDVLINGKKLCGILIETKATIDSLRYAIIGIGINVQMRPVDHPEIQTIATSLNDETGKYVLREEVVHELFVRMEHLYLSSLAGESLFPRWRDNLITLGKQVRATAPDKVYEGVAESVAEDGSLQLRLQDGNLLKFTVGDVTLRG